jgi:hypothetical protein
MKSFMFVVGLLPLLLNGCGAPAAPIVDPAQVQASAVAGAHTIVAMTQAAIPSGTPMPLPTDTPLPNPSPTLGIQTAAIPTNTPLSGKVNCVHPLDIGSAGPQHQTLIRNETAGTINLSLNLYQANSFGECGSISYAGLSKNSTLMAQLPEGYWYAYSGATINGKNITASGSFWVQPAQFDKVELCVRSGIIVYKPQC